MAFLTCSALHCPDLCLESEDGLEGLQLIPSGGEGWSNEILSMTRHTLQLHPECSRTYIYTPHPNQFELIFILFCTSSVLFLCSVISICQFFYEPFKLYYIHIFPPPAKEINVVIHLFILQTFIDIYSTA